jgi:hypothetical protein
MAGLCEAISEFDKPIVEHGAAAHPELVFITPASHQMGILDDGAGRKLFR